MLKSKELSSKFKRTAAILQVKVIKLLINVKDNTIIIIINIDNKQDYKNKGDKP